MFIVTEYAALRERGKMKDLSIILSQLFYNFNNT